MALFKRAETITSNKPNMLKGDLLGKVLTAPLTCMKQTSPRQKKKKSGKDFRWQTTVSLSQRPELYSPHVALHFPSAAAAAPPGLQQWCCRETAIS